jgi:hypothetical protein
MELTGEGERSQRGGKGGEGRGSGREKEGARKGLGGAWEGVGIEQRGGREVESLERV